MLKHDKSKEYLSTIMSEQFEKSMTLFLEDYNTNKTEINHTFMQTLDKLCVSAFRCRKERKRMKLHTLFYGYFISKGTVGFNYQALLELAKR